MFGRTFVIVLLVCVVRMANDAAAAPAVGPSRPVTAMELLTNELIVADSVYRSSPTNEDRIMFFSEETSNDRDRNDLGLVFRKAIDMPIECTPGKSRAADGRCRWIVKWNY